MRNAIAMSEPPVTDHWQCFTAPGTGVPPASTPRIGLKRAAGNRCPSCGHLLAEGVIEVRTGITERRQLRKINSGWHIGHVDPACFGETWYECGAGGALLPEAIARRIATEL